MLKEANAQLPGHIYLKKTDGNVLGPYGDSKGVTKPRYNSADPFVALHAMAIKAPPEKVERPIQQFARGRPRGGAPRTSAGEKRSLSQRAAIPQPERCGMSSRTLHMPNSRKGQKYVTLDDLALELGCPINLSDTVENLKVTVSSKKFCPVSNVRFSIHGRDIPSAAVLKDNLDMNTRFMLSWRA